MNNERTTVALIITTKGQTTSNFNVIIGRYPQNSTSRLRIVLQDVYINRSCNFSKYFSDYGQNVMFVVFRRYFIIEVIVQFPVIRKLEVSLLQMRKLNENIKLKNTNKETSK